jgi:hypothetical protein
MRLLAAAASIGITLLGWAPAGMCAETLAELFARVHRGEFFGVPQNASAKDTS